MRSKSMPETYNTDLDWQERALHYGDGLFETLLKFDGEIPYWKAHYARLSRGCKRLSIPTPDETWLKTQVEVKSSGAEHMVIKIIVSRGRGGRGLQLPEQNPASVFVICYPWSNSYNRELRVVLCKTRLPINPGLAGLKHLNRLDYVLASLELQQKPGIGEGILCDSDGFLVEGIISNLFFIDQGRVYTPSLDLAGVDGIMRQQVIEQLDKERIPVEIGRYPVQQLLDASECFLCNSVRGISPIVALDQQEYSIGETTRSLMAALNISAVTL